MKIFSLASIFLVIGTSQAMPQYGQVPAQGAQHGRAPAQGGQHGQVNAQAPKSPNNQQQQNLPDGCRIEYQDFHSIIHIESEEEVCTPYNERVCETKYRQACEPYEEEVCKVEYKQECEVKYNEVCNDLSRDIVVPYVEDECNHELTRVCEFHWVVLDNGDKVWEENPKKCKEIPETKCKQVQKTKTKQEPYTECNNVPYDDCRDVPVQKCQNVIRQKCEQVPYDDCKDVTRTNCKNVHKKVPQTHTQRKAVRVCDGGNDIADYDAAINAEDSDFNTVIIDGARTGLLNDGEDHDDNIFAFSN